MAQSTTTTTQPPTPQISASTIRIRENQRRSRARRKEYIQDLEVRLRKFETQGVQATVEVQNAARRVARENTLLRSLLGLAGISNSEVEEFLYRSERAGVLAGSNNNNNGLVYPVVDGGEGGEEGEGEGRDKDRDLDADGDRDGDGWGKSGVDVDVDVNLDMDEAARIKMMMTMKMRQSDRESYIVSDDYEPSCTSRYTNHSHLPAARPPTMTVHSTPPPKDELHTNTGNTISCERAASIIAGMRGHYDNDNERIRAELGCSPDARSCTVDNMRVFYAMDG